MTNPIEFIDQNIKLNEKGQPWTLSLYQRTVLKLMFARAYLIRLWSEIKKSGKTFVAACIAIWEAMSNPDCEIVCVANDEEQAISRVFSTVRKLIEYNPELAASAQVLATEIRFTNGSIIKAVSSDYKGQAGGRQRLTVFDELWAFDLERMVRLFEEMTPPPTEPGAYVLIVSYAGFTGEGELLENLYKRGLAGKRIHKTLEVYRDQGLCMFWSHKPRQPWQQGVQGKRYYDEQRRILRPGTFARLHENRWVSSESTFITPDQWGAIVQPTLTPSLATEVIYCGVDIGVKSDTTGAVSVKWDADGKKIIIVDHKMWKPTRRESVNLADVQDYVLELSRRHDLQVVLFDPSQGYQMIQALQAELGERVVQEFPQTQPNGVLMGETLFNLVSNRNLIAYPSDTLMDHICNATGTETPRGVRMTKSTGRRKIDLAIALAMACVSAIRAGANLGSISDIMVGGGYLPTPRWDGENRQPGSGDPDASFDQMINDSPGSASGGTGNREWW